MDKTKIVPIVFLVIILSIGFIAYKFYSDSQVLTKKAGSLEGEKKELANINKSLAEKNKELTTSAKDLEERWSKIESELSYMDKEREKWQKKYEAILKERDLLIERVKSLDAGKLSNLGDSSPAAKAAGSADLSQDYWIDFIKSKAALEVDLENLKRDQASARDESAKALERNKELSMQVDVLKREKERLEREMVFKVRTMDILSRDMVNEREDRKRMKEEVDNLRKENVDLRRELTLVNREKKEMEASAQDLTAKSGVLQKKVSEIESLLREKSLVFEELKEQLNYAVKPELGAPEAGDKEVAAVELPPIVVKPGAGLLEGFRGEVIAVNREEKFVVVDLGEASGIKAGTQLKVKRGDKEIGTIEVIEIRKEISAADIKGETLVIKEGDTVVGK